MVVVGVTQTACGGGSSGAAGDGGVNSTCDAGGARRLSLSPRQTFSQAITSLAWQNALWLTAGSSLHRWSDRELRTEPFEVAGNLGNPGALTATVDQVLFIADGANGARSIYRVPLDTDTPTAPLTVVNDVLNDVMAAEGDQVFYAVPAGVAKKQIVSSVGPEKEPELFLRTDSPPVGITAANGELMVVVPNVGAGPDAATILITSSVSQKPVREVAKTKLTKYVLYGNTLLWLDGERLMEVRKDGSTPPSVRAEIPGAMRPFRIDDATLGVFAESRIVRLAGDCNQEIPLQGQPTAVATTGTLGIYVSVGTSLLRSN